MAYVVVKLPLAVVGIYAAFSLWWDAFACLTYTLWNSGQNSPPVFGLVRNLFPPGYLSVGTSGFFHGIAVFVTGVILLFAAPWAVRGVVYLDRRLMHALLAPDSMTMRVRSLEHARAQTVDASAATLRRIERDLHDGTQAQLVALAMRLGMAKEKLARRPHVDLDQVRALVDDAHRGAKEALVELRDLARGHPPPRPGRRARGRADARWRRAPPSPPRSPWPWSTAPPRPSSRSPTSVWPSSWPTWPSTPTPRAPTSRARSTPSGCGWSCATTARAGPQPARLGSSSSGLAGLTDRVHAVDGRLNIASPPGGPTVVTVDLPLHA